MSNIEERVVQMKFNHDGFESGISKAVEALQKLKSTLSFSKEVKELDGLEKKAHTFSLDGFKSAIDSAANKAGMLSAFYKTAFDEIINLGKKTFAELDKYFGQPIRAGFSEYETQINAVQTILANTSAKGTTIDQVNRALDELNHYADLTIYNFTEMTRNIGTFTAAGVDLDTSVAAIKGIANLAAVSGSTSQQASTAMYQLSQALASGTVKLMDWNSVVNAGMGGEVFQNALKETARVHGIAIDQIIEQQGSFRESLSEGWLSSEILIETLQKFTGDLSEEQLRSMGYTEEQIRSIIELGNMANDAATKVKTFTQLFDTLNEARQSGWTQTFELIIGDFEQAKEFLTDISNLLNGIIGQSADRRNQLLEEALGKPTQYITQSKWEEFAASGAASDEFVAAIMEVARQHGIAIDQMIADEGSFEATLESGWLTNGIIEEALNTTTTQVTEAQHTVQDMQALVQSVINGDWGNGEERIRRLTEAGYDYWTVQDLVNQELLYGGVQWENLTDDQLRALGVTEEQIAVFGELRDTMRDADSPLSVLLGEGEKLSGRELMLQGIYDIIGSIVLILNNLKSAWENAFPPITGSTIYGYIEAFSEFANSINTFITDHQEQFERAFTGLFNILGIGADIVGAVGDAFGMLFDSIPDGNEDLLETVAAFGDMITNFRNALKESGKLQDFTQKLADVLISIGTVIGGVFDTIVKWFNGEELDLSWIDFLKDKLSGLWTSISSFSFKPLGDFLRGLSTWLSDRGINIDILDSIADFFDTFTIGGVVESIKTAFSDLGGWLESFFASLPIQELWASITNFDLSSFDIVGAISGAYQGLQDWFSQYGIDFHPIEDIQDKFNGFIEWVKTTFGIDGAIFESLYDSFNDFNTWLSNFKIDTSFISGLKDSLFGWISALDIQFDPFAVIRQAFEDFKGWIESFSISGSSLSASLAASVRDPMERLTVGDATVQAIPDIIDAIKNAFDDFRKWLGGFTGEESATFSGFIYAIGDALDKFSQGLGYEDFLDFLRALPDIAGKIITLGIGIKIYECFDNLGDAIERLSGGSMSDRLLKVGIALGIVSVSLFALSQLEIDQIATGLLGLAGAVAALVVPLIILNGLGKTGSGLKFGFSTGFAFIGIAFAISMLVGIVKDIAGAGIGIFDAFFALEIITALGLILDAIVIIGSKSGGLVGIFEGIAFDLIAAAIGILVGLTLDIVHSGVDLSEVERAAEVVAKLALILAAAIGFVEYVGKFGVLSGLGADLIAVAVGILVDLTMQIARSGVDEERISFATMVVGGLALVLGAATSLATAAAGYAGVGSALAGDLGLGVAAGCMAAIAYIVIQLSNSEIDEERMQKSAMIIGGLSGVLISMSGLATTVTSYSGWQNALVGDLGLGVATGCMAAIAQVIIDISAYDIDNAKMEKTAIIMGGLSAMVVAVSSVATAVTSAGGWQNALVGDLGLATATESLNSIATSLISVATCGVTQEQIEDAAEILMGMEGFVTAIAGISAVIGGATKIEGLFGSISLGVATLSISELADTLLRFTGIDLEDISGGLEGLGIALGGLVVASIATAIPGVAEAMLVLAASVLMIGTGVNLACEGLTTLGNAISDFLGGLNLDFLRDWNEEFERVTHLEPDIDPIIAQVEYQYPELIESLGPDVQLIPNSIMVVPPKDGEIDYTVLDFTTGQVIEVPADQIDLAISGWEEAGINVVDSLGTSISSHADLVTQPIQDIGETAIRTFNGVVQIGSPSKVFSDMGKYIDEGLGLGLEQNQNIPMLAVTKMGTMLITTMTLVIPLFIKKGGEITQAIASGISSKLSSVSFACRQLMYTISNSINGYDYLFYQVGERISQGLANGIARGSSAAVAAASNMASQALSSAKNTLGIASPSKEFEKLGVFSSEGYEYGLTKHVTSVEMSAQKLGISAIDALTRSLSNVDDNISSEFGTPVITPVVDLSNVQNAKLFVDRAFGSSTLAFANQVSADYSNYQRERKINSDAERTEMVSAINTLNDRMATMNDEFLNMQVVMDGRAVVGQLSSKIDRSLAARAARKARGI